MASKRKPESPQPQNLPLVENADAIPSVYSNSVEVLSMNLVDVRLAFNEVVIESGNRFRVLRRANVVLPKAAFTTMMRVLELNAKNLEAVASSHQRQLDQELAKMLSDADQPQQG